MNGAHGFCPFCGEKISAAEPETNATQNLIGRMYMFLEDGNFQSAHMYAERILDIDLRCADAYLCKVMVSLGIRKKEDFVYSNPAFKNSPDFKRAMEFADDTLKQELSGYLQAIHTNEMNKKLAFALQCMQNARTEQNFLKAAELFKPLSGFENADSLYEICLKRAEEAAFNQAEQWIAESTVSSLQKATDLLKRLPQKQDTDDKIAFCETKIAEIKQKKRKKIKWAGIISLVLVVTLAASYFLYFADLFKYNKAIDLLEQGKHQQAYELFKELGDFKDSKAYFDKFEWTVIKEIRTDSDGDQTIGEYQYNKDGLNTKIIYTASDGNQDITEYQYNEDGLVTKETITLSFGDFITEYQYNEDGLVTKETTTWSGGDLITEYQYNKNGLVTKSIHTNSDGYQDITEYQYNEDGLVTKKLFTNSNGFQYITEYQYNKSGLVTKGIYSASNGYQDITEYQYNEDGLKTKETKTWSDGDQELIEYEYGPVYKKNEKKNEKKKNNRKPFQITL